LYCCVLFPVLDGLLLLLVRTDVGRFCCQHLGLNERVVEQRSSENRYVAEMPTYQSNVSRYVVSTCHREEYGGRERIRVAQRVCRESEDLHSLNEDRN
jgi:hypothetical protein